MIEEVKDLVDDVRDKLGDKGFMILACALGGFGVYLVYKSFHTPTVSNEEYAPVGVTGYPDIGANADEVMGSVNSAIEGSYNDMSSLLESRLEYIEGVLSDMDNNASQNTSEIIQNSNQNTSAIIQNSNQNTQEVIQNSNQNTQEIIQTTEEVKQDFSAVVKQAVQNTENQTQNVVSSTLKTTTTKTTSTPKTTQKKEETYTYTTKAGLNTNTSIVDALKATGADSSFNARAEIYYKNGGKGTYTGSYSQNVEMLNKMKSGQLKK